MNWNQLDKLPLTVKLAVVVSPLMVIGVVISGQAAGVYQRHMASVQPQVVTNVVSGKYAVLDETYPPPPDGSGTYSPPPGSYPPPPEGSSPPPSGSYSPPTGTEPAYQQPTGTTPPPDSSQYQQPPAGSGTGTNSTPPPSDSQQQYTPPPNGSSTGSYPDSGDSQQQSQYQSQYQQQYQQQQNGSAQGGSSPPPPPVFTVNNADSCIESVLGADAASKFRSGAPPTAEQMTKVNNAGCFSARVSYGPPPSGQEGANAGPGQSGANQPGVFSSIAIAPPAQFQQDSPMLSCAKKLLGDKFGQGAPPTPDQMAQLKAKCFSQYGDPGQGQGQGEGGNRPYLGSAENPGSPLSMPPELKACVIKAGISEGSLSSIQRGQSPTADQQKKGENCFKKYAEEKGIAIPMLTPPDLSQPFDPNSKQNQCADLIAQAHGLRFNQINPKIVSGWSLEEVGQLRSCYGVAAPSSGANGLAFAPTTSQVAVSSSKLTCIEGVVGADKLAAVIAGTASITNADRLNVYNKCINPTKIASGADPALLGVLSAMPPSDLESQFIPVDATQLPVPSASGTSQSANGEVGLEGEYIVAAGSELPSKVDVFVKSTPETFTVQLTKVSATKATWKLSVAQNKLALGSHKTYAVATLGDASQVRSPDGTFVLTAAKTKKSNLPLIIGVSISSALALAVGGWIAIRWHAKKALLPSFVARLGKHDPADRQ